MKNIMGSTYNLEFVNCNFELEDINTAKSIRAVGQKSIKMINSIDKIGFISILSSPKMLFLKNSTLRENEKGDFNPKKILTHLEI